jgi:hypothetical protein
MYEIDYEELPNYVFENIIEFLNDNYPEPSMGTWYWREGYKLMVSEEIGVFILMKFT